MIFLASEQGKEMRYTTQQPPINWFDQITNKESSGCQHNGKFFDDGAQIPSKDKCEHCYCMRDEIVCAIQECRPPCDGCIPIWTDNDSCCPEKYECCTYFFSSSSMITMIIIKIMTFLFLKIHNLRPLKNRIVQKQHLDMNF